MKDGPRAKIFNSDFFFAFEQIEFWEWCHAGMEIFQLLQSFQWKIISVLTFENKRTLSITWSISFIIENKKHITHRNNEENDSGSVNMSSQQRMNATDASAVYMQIGQLIRKSVCCVYIVCRYGFHRILPFLLSTSIGFLQSLFNYAKRTELHFISNHRSFSKMFIEKLLFTYNG